MYENIDQNTVVTPRELASVLRLTTRHVRRLYEDGVLQKTDSGYNLADNVEAYYRMKYDRPESEDMAQMDVAMRAAELKLKDSKAKIAEMEAEELAGKMHRAEDVEAVTSDMVFTVRSALMSLPGRLAMNLVNIPTAAEVSQIIRKEVNLIMNELAHYKYDPARYEELVRDRMDWNAAQSEEE